MIVFCVDDDGDVSVHEMTEEQISDMLADDASDSGKEPSIAEGIDDLESFERFSGYIFIEGRIVTPSPVEKVTAWTFEK